MEGQNNSFDFLPDDLAYDDLIHNAGWPANTQQQQQYAFAQPSHDPYARFASSQPGTAQGHYNINQQQSYPAVSYSNSPYAAQYQHARPSDVFGPTSYNVDPSLQSSTYHGHDSSFSFAHHTGESATIAPQSLQYGVNQNQNQALNRTVSNSAFPQRSASSMGNNFQQVSQDQSSNMYFQNNQNDDVHLNQANSIRYPVLPNATPETEPKPFIKKQELDPMQTTRAVPRPQQIQLAASSNPLRITHPDLFESRDASSQARLEYAPFLVFEATPVPVSVGLKNTLPKYHPRKSRSGKDLVPGYDLSRSLTPARSSTKKGRPPKEPKSTVSKYKGTSQASRALAIKAGTLREGDQLASVKSPSTPTETSSSEDESGSSEEESEYEDDEMPVTDISTVRGETRPTTTPEATQYDAIGIIWKDPYSSPSIEAMKEAMKQYGDFITAQRVEIKTITTKIDKAVSPELERLRARRIILLDSLRMSVDAANEHGFPYIVEHLGGHHKMVNDLVMTLIDCTKERDYLGQLPKAILGLLARFQTMSDELLQKCNFAKVQARWSKKGDDETKKNIALILANTTNAKEKAAKAKKDAEQAEKEKKIKEARARVGETSTSQPVNPAKRPHEGDGPNGKPTKKIATDANGTTSKPGPPRKVGNLLGISSKPVPKPAPKKRESPPPTESKLSALLASIAKAPEPPKAAEAPPRPPETPEEKARRERKESRRHLRVKFKEGLELEQIRLFKHEQAEDEGREDEMVRDAHEHRLEGMMHKKRLSEAMDEDDEYQPSEPEIPYPELIELDFRNLEKSPRGETYITRGGSQTFTTPEQTTQSHREGVELMVIYTVASDIPPTPKELLQADPSQMDGADDFRPDPLLKGPTEPWLVQRLDEIKIYGPVAARQMFQQRQSQQQWNTQHNLQHGIPQSFARPSTEVSSILQQTPTQQRPHNPLDTVDPSAMANILRIVESLKGKPFPPQEPPEWMNQAQKDEWWAGFNRDKAAKEAREQAEASRRIVAQIQAAHLQQPTILPQQFAPQPPQMTYQIPIPQPSGPIPHIPDLNQQVQNFLNGYQNSDTRGAPTQQYDFTGWGNSAIQDGYAGQSQQPRWDSRDGRDGRDGNWNDNTKSNRSHSREKKQRGGHNSKQSNETSFLDEHGEYKGKKRPCTFYRQGKCAKGAACTFLHDD
ncbi:related to tpa inducible protein [Phialocephala subalpina]|uniref:Related to tpa inducible protein n=1 Tax=Phialocephala subalpina TaxID=576137 RepID=A0A1L7X4E2_9HELO|nr:related to tpa inducible protein [Phialocephala subalpina]